MRFENFVESNEAGGSNVANVIKWINVEDSLIEDKTKQYLEKSIPKTKVEQKNRQVSCRLCDSLVQRHKYEQKGLVSSTVDCEYLIFLLYLRKY
ncbi:hypothetical protein BpHYR1_028950 [Brachionus plicatilis]|uniref:Uncharacterized protein n=1 Tax=Brachionus plicatilis TaxID=10195 RepID=A0A3M7PR10_BRAPC|nr:hypothetical protein BpHYR1_028950 [Brachionus plicatilis]